MQAEALTKANRHTPLALLLTVPKFYKCYAPVLDLSGQAVGLQNELPLPVSGAAGGWVSEEGEEELEDEEEEKRRRGSRKKAGDQPAAGAQRIRLEATLV
jgi:hypothetical protein